VANLQAITKTDFATKTWQRCADFLFTENDSVCPLAAQELPQAMLSMPIAFILADEDYSLVAVQGLQPDTNFYLNADGKWVGKYVPAAYRSYPFLLAQNEAEKDQLVLCIDGDCGLVTEDIAGEPFFDEAGELSATLAELVEFLSKVNDSRGTTMRILKSLQQHNLLKPWELEIKVETGIKKVEGLYCIDEPALNSLSDEAFIELRKAGALLVAYCQLLSMQHISELAQIVQAKAKSAVNLSAPELNMDSITDDGNISFDNL
jgi:hypothetical protein